MSSKTFVCEEEGAQRVYDYLFTNKPEYFQVYAQDEEDNHIYVRFPFEIGLPKVNVEIVKVERVADTLVAWVVPLGDLMLSNRLCTYAAASQAHIVLGSFLQFRLQEVEYLRRMTRELMHELLEAYPCEDPILKDFIV